MKFKQTCHSGTAECMEKLCTQKCARETAISKLKQRMCSNLMWPSSTHAMTRTFALDQATYTPSRGKCEMQRLQWLQVAWPDKLPSDFTRHFVFNWKITNIHRNYQSATKHEDLKDWGLSRIKYIALPWMFWLAFHGFQIPRSVSAWFNINENCSLAKSNGLCPRSNKIWSLSLLGFHPIPRWNLSQNWRNTKITCTSYNPNRSPDFYCKCKYVLTRQEGQEKNSELRLFTTQWKHATCMSFVSPVAAFKDFLWGCSLQISADLFPRSLSRGSSVLKRWFKHTIFDRVAAAAKKRSWASLPSTEVFGAFKGKTKRSKKSAKSAKKKCLFFAKKLFGLFFLKKKSTPSHHMSWAVREQHRKTVMSTVVLLFLRQAQACANCMKGHEMTWVSEDMSIMSQAQQRNNAKNKMIRSDSEQCSSHLYTDPASSIFCIELLKRFTWIQKRFWLILQTVLMVLGTWWEHRRIVWKFKSLEFKSSWCWSRIKKMNWKNHGTSAPLTRLARRSLGQNRHDESPHMPHFLPQSAKGTKAQHGLLWTRQCNWSPKNITLCNPRDICLAWLFANHLP